MDPHRPNLPAHIIWESLKSLKWLQWNPTCVFIKILHNYYTVLAIAYYRQVLQKVITLYMFFLCGIGITHVGYCSLWTNLVFVRSQNQGARSYSCRPFFFLFEGIPYSVYLLQYTAFLKKI